MQYRLFIKLHIFNFFLFYFFPSLFLSLYYFLRIISFSKVDNAKGWSGCACENTYYHIFQIGYLDAHMLAFGLTSYIYLGGFTLERRGHGLPEFYFFEGLPEILLKDYGHLCNFIKCTYFFSIKCFFSSSLIIFIKYFIL